MGSGAPQRHTLRPAQRTPASLALGAPLCHCSTPTVVRSSSCLATKRATSARTRSSAATACCCRGVRHERDSGGKPPSSPPAAACGALAASAAAASAARRPPYCSFVAASVEGHTRAGRGGGGRVGQASGMLQVPRHTAACFITSHMRRRRRRRPPEESTVLSTSAPAAPGNSSPVTCRGVGVQRAVHRNRFVSRLQSCTPQNLLALDSPCTLRACQAPLGRRCCGVPSGAACQVSMPLTSSACLARFSSTARAES